MQKSILQSENWSCAEISKYRSIFHGLRRFHGRFAPQNAVRRVSWNGKLSDLTKIVYLKTMDHSSPKFWLYSSIGGTFWRFEAKKVEFFGGHIFYFIRYLKNLWQIGASSILEIFSIKKWFSGFQTKLQECPIVLLDISKTENSMHPNV